MRSNYIRTHHLISVVLSLLLLCLAACDESQPLVIPRGTDAGSQVDMQASQADALVEVDSGSIDMGLDATSDVDAMIALPEGCIVGESATSLSKPDAAHVQVLFTGYQSLIIWADENGVHRCDIDQEGRFVGDHQLIAPPVEGEIAFVQTARVGAYAYVSISYPGVPIVILRIDREGIEPLPLAIDDLVLSGPALLSAVDGALVVFGQTGSGSIGWAMIENSWTPPVFTQTSGFEGLFPDDVVAVPSGVFLRFGASGQCAFFDGTQRNLVSSMPCSLGNGGFVGNGESARVWQLKRVEAELYVSLESLFDQDAELVMGKLETEALLAWPKTRGFQPVIARRIVSEPSGRQGDLQLYLAGSDRLLESLTTWQTSFPFESARAVHLRETTVINGVCTDSEQSCETDDDCFGGALCDGRLGPYVADVISFGAHNQPQLSAVGMAERTLRSTATIFDEQSNCIPVPEACDGRDQDCDDRQDDGVCCHVSQGRNDLNLDWTSGAPVEEFMISDVGNESAYLFVYRAFEGLVSRWRGFTVTLNERDNGTHFDTIGSCNYPGGNCTEEWSNSEHYPFAIDAGPGRAFMAIGGTRVLIAKTSTEAQAPWAIYWIHAYRNHKPFNESDGPVVLPAECEELMVVEGLNRADGGESMVLVCPDRIIRAYPNPERSDITWRFDGPELGGLNTILWATKLRNGSFGSHDRGFDLLVAFESDFGGVALRAFRFVTDDDGPPIPTPLNILHPLLENIDSEALREPIYLNRDSDGPLIRITDGVDVEYASSIEGADQVTVRWQPVQVGSRPNRVVYSQLEQQLVFFGEPLETGETPVYVSSTAESEGRTGLWALEQTFSMPSSTIFSETSQAFYYYNVVQISEDADGGDRNFDLRLVNLQCLAP